MDEMGMLNSLISPDYAPTTAQELNEIQNAMDGWLATSQEELLRGFL